MVNGATDQPVNDVVLHSKRTHKTKQRKNQATQICGKNPDESSVNLRKLFGGKSVTAIDWGLDEAIRDSDRFQQIRKLRTWCQAKKTEAVLPLRLKALPVTDLGTNDLLYALQLIHSWPDLKKRAGEQVEPLAEQLRQLVDRTVDEGQLSALDFQLVGVEIPLAIALAVENDVDTAEQMAVAATTRFASSIHRMLDGDGWPEARFLVSLGPLIASWTRTRVMLEKAQLPLDKTADEQLEWLVRQVIRLLRPDGFADVVQWNDSSHVGCVSQNVHAIVR